MKILLSVWKVDEWTNKKKDSSQWPESFLIRIVKSDTDQKLERDKLFSTEKKFSFLDFASNIVVQNFRPKVEIRRKGGHWSTVVFLSSHRMESLLIS